MANLTNFLEGELADHVLRNSAYTSPTTVYVGLFTSDPGEAGSTLNEVSGGGYARQAVTFGAATNGICANNADVSFPIAEDDWGVITHLALFDALSGGNMLFYGAATAPITINTTDIYRIVVGELTAGFA